MNDRRALDVANDLIYILEHMLTKDDVVKKFPISAKLVMHNIFHKEICFYIKLIETIRGSVENLVMHLQGY